MATVVDVIEEALDLAKKEFTRKCKEEKLTEDDFEKIIRLSIEKQVELIIPNTHDISVSYYAYEYPLKCSISIKHKDAKLWFKVALFTLNIKVDSSRENTYSSEVIELLKESMDSSSIKEVFNNNVLAFGNNLYNEERFISEKKLIEEKIEKLNIEVSSLGVSTTTENMNSLFLLRELSKDLENHYSYIRNREEHLNYMNYLIKG